jgi:hypothetical protein
MKKQLDMSKLSELKALMQLSRNIEKVWEYFMDNFGDFPAFQDQGQRMRDPYPQILSSVRQIAMKNLVRYGLANDNINFDNSVLISIPEYNFIHGFGTVMGFDGNKGFLTNVLYFEDIKLGVVLMMVEDGRTDYARFSLTVPPPGSVANN